jgi:phosphohistidine phosphatase
MELGLLRHADALPANGGSIPTDESRPLSAKGNDQARDVGVFLKKTGRIPNLILSSPYLRARQTAEGVRHGLGLEVPLVVVPALACEVKTALQADAIIKEIETARLGRGTWVLAVAHMSDLAELAGHYLSCEADSIGFEKAGLAILGFPSVPVESMGHLIQWTNSELHALVAATKD